MNEVRTMLAKADDCLESAVYNLKGDFLDAATNRAYYGVFDALSALLLAKKLSAKSHSGAQSLFNEHFVKTGLFPKEAGMWINFCFQMRQQSDYDFSSKIELEEAKQVVEYCERFIILAKAWLNDNPE